MATQNHTNYTPAATFGVEVDGVGRIKFIAHGEISARIGEQVANKLVELSHAIRDEVRRDVVLPA